MNFKTMWELFQNLETRHKGISIPLITDGVNYEESRTIFFDLKTNLVRKKKYVKAIIYRLPSGHYELVDYVC